MLSIYLLYPHFAAPVCTLPVSEPLQEPHSSTLHEEPSPEEIRSKDSLPSDVPLPSQQSSDPYPFKSHQSGHVLLNQGPEIVSVIYTSTPEESSQIFFLEDLGSGNHLHGNVAVLPPGLDSSTFGNSSQIAIQGDGPEISCFSQDMGSECMDSKDKKAKIKKRKQSDNEEHQRDRKKREADRQKYVRLNKCITETMLKSNNSYLQDENKKLSEKITKLNEELYISQIDRGVALAVNPVNGNSTPEKRIKKTLLINKVENLIYCNDDKNAKIVSLKKELQMLHSEFSILNAKILQQLGIASKNQHSEVIHKTSLENRNVKKESFTVDHQDVNIDEDIRHLINEVNLLTNKSGNKDLEIRNLGLRINETKVKIKCIKDYEGKQEMPNSK
ncbi:hypothetical protein SK128_010687 [Halocaridina rubra]|uniref:Uncharacterized protein n=1 Tax=Halocaridina rubra TaxID=373956 RepID=A0AAN8XB32_HALRR